VLGFTQRRSAREHVAEAREECGQHVPFGAHLVRLPVVPDGGLLANDRHARIGLDLVGDDAKERGLPCPVRSHQSGAIARTDGEGHVLEKGVARVTEADIPDLKHGHGAPRLAQ
jgi:hypothetical protein